MGYPHGLAPIEDGSGVLHGTSPADMQRIIGSRWGNPGIIAGCKVTGGSSMQWTISAGAVVVETGTGLAVEVPVETTPVAAIPAPASGTRRDYIFVTATTGTDGDLSGQVRISSTEPTLGTVVATVMVPADATSTAQMSVETAVRFALPASASLGLLAEWKDPAADQSVVPDNGYQTLWSKTLPILPTDRLVEVEVIQCASLQGDRRAQGGMWHRVYVDGAMVAGVGMDLSFSWSRRTAVVPVELVAGVAHTIRYDRSRDWFEPSSAVPKFFVTSTVRSGVRVWDRGAIR